MKNYCIVTLLFSLFVSKVMAQESYSDLTSEAIHIINVEEETKYQKAYQMIENAFEAFPDSIDGTGLYYASTLNAMMKNYDKAFEYLIPLAEMEKDEDGYPGWSYVLDDYAEDDYKNLMSDPRWKTLKQQAQKDSLVFFQTLKQSEDEFFKTSGETLTPKNKGLYKAIQTYNPYITKKQSDYSIALNINDSTSTSYHVHLPENYDPNQKYSMLFFLHGAVGYGKLDKYQIPEVNLSGWNRYYKKYGDLNNVVLIFTSANKQYNWMMSDDGFFMIPEIVKSVKKAINIDDNKIFITGHSNGATGSFSYLMKAPTDFAGCYGFNTYPKVFTGGTFVENMTNRSFINFSTNQDYYYPPNANDQMDSVMLSLNMDYKDYRYEGFPHWFPKFDESEPAYQLLFEDLNKRTRNPFPTSISWELDDNNYANIDWLSAIKLDTLQAQESWQKEINFTIDQWQEYNKEDSLITIDVHKDAFSFPRKSGKVIAKYEDNTFEIKTSRISSLAINISPEMVDLHKKVKVFINQKLYFNGKVKYDKEFMHLSFEQNRDRSQVWVNQIKLEL
ncbi:alpha/beta hydrolase-fold protein [Flammeovirga sp. EKP202]|uniref:alpha/beta hydrolase-fold protein n=1 Tax=Flammeovirga sp. EKP202 TaxID=2770592 RepID=UPI00165F7D07|nr:alpha/beta hydrolase-fold protein [Flammeovirga sp. EKP202]MBD0403479.1 hypothetical protein [Flammeovirga sp. EKP202]